MPAATARRRSSLKPSSQTRLLVRFREVDSSVAVTRETASRLARTLGLSENQVVHLALAQLAHRTLPAYPADDGPLSDAALRAIRRLEPQGRMKTSKSLF